MNFVFLRDFISGHKMVLYNINCISAVPCSTQTVLTFQIAIRLQTVLLPSVLKKFFNTFLEKPGSEPILPRNYCPISKLLLVLKVVEKVVATQLFEIMQRKQYICQIPIWLQKEPQYGSSPTQSNR